VADPHEKAQDLLFSQKEVIIDISLGNNRETPNIKKARLQA
jgi:hypothetical protein